MGRRCEGAILVIVVVVILRASAPLCQSLFPYNLWPLQPVQLRVTHRGERIFKCNITEEGPDSKAIQLGRQICLDARGPGSIMFERPKSLVRVVSLEMDGVMTNAEAKIEEQKGVFKLGGFEKARSLSVDDCEAWAVLVGQERDSLLKKYAGELATGVVVYMLTDLGDPGLSYRVAHFTGYTESTAVTRIQAVSVVEAVERCDRCKEQGLSCIVYC